MSESLRDLVVSLSLNTDNFTRNIKSVNKQIQEAESYFKLASAGIKGFDTSAAGLSAKLSTLERELDLQKSAVEQYQRALAAASAKLTECYNRQGEYAERLSEAKDKQSELASEVADATAQYEQYRDTLGETDSATIAAKQNMEAAKQEYDAASEEVEKLSGQNDALQRSTQNAADAVSTAQTQLNKAEAAVRETEAAISETSSALQIAKSSWTSAGAAMTDFGKQCTEAGKKLSQIGGSMTRCITTPIAGLGIASIKAGIDFESSFASVRKTVDASEEEFARLAEASKNMSTEVAASTTTINEVMATGGQLGIATEHMEEFTRVMIDLSNSCEDLNAEEAATSIAKFANIMGTDQSNFSNIGSTIVDLGNNFATTEKPIMEMAQRLAGAGRQVGMSEADILGFAAALSSVGIEAQMGGSSFSKAMVKMEVATVEGGQALDDFASISGMSSEQFKAMWDANPADAFMAFIVGLSQMDEEGISAIATLNDIGISEIRLRDTLLRATNATELFQSALDRSNAAWEENTALSTEANKRYATTESKLTNLKNKVVLLGQRIADDLSPVVSQVIEFVNGLLDKFAALDDSQREQIIKWAAIAAAAGPVVSTLGKVTTVVGTVSGGLGKFATAVGKAGGGFSGFLKTLASSPAVWVAVAAGVTVGIVALVDFVSGAKAARQNLEELENTAKKWKETAADTFYRRSEGLSAFGMSENDFHTLSTTTASTGESLREWSDRFLEKWEDTWAESGQDVKDFTESFKAYTAQTRNNLTELKTQADELGQKTVSDQIQADIDTLDAIDTEVTELIRKSQTKYLTDAEKARLEELIAMRNQIEDKYSTANADLGGFEKIRKKVNAEIGRAEVRGQKVSASLYEDALVAAAQGMGVVNDALDAQYDKEYDIIMMMDDENARQAALNELNTRYIADRKAAAMEYANLIKDMVMPVWQQESIQKTGEQVDELTDLLWEYDAAATDAEKNAALAKINKLTQGMDESSLVEYMGVLTQIQSLLDSGMSEEDINDLFPDIDVSSAIEQLAIIQEYLSSHNWDTNLTSLNEMFGTALGDEMLTLTVDLNMDGAKARWEQWAQNPGEITTDAVVYSYMTAENAMIQQPAVNALIDKYTEVEEGADKASLTPEGILAYVSTYAELTNGADTSGLTPENITALVSAYDEAAAGADLSLLTPDEVTALVMEYLEKSGVDTSGLSPDTVTAFVMAYEEITGGASTSTLSPKNVVGIVSKFCQAENIDITSLSPDQIEAIVSKFSEATGCDKSELMQEFVAYITEYKEVNNVKKPKLTMTIGFSGYDLLNYRKWMKQNSVEIEGFVHLSEVYDDTNKVLTEGDVKFWQKGIEIPVTAVTPDMLSPEDICLLDEDGTMHVLLKTEVTGTEEAVEEAKSAFDPKHSGYTEFDEIMLAANGVSVPTLNTYIQDSMSHIVDWENHKDGWRGWMYGDKDDMNNYLQTMFDPVRTAELSTYVAEMSAYVAKGGMLSAEDIGYLRNIQIFTERMTRNGVGKHITDGITEGLAEAGWDTTEEELVAQLDEIIEYGKSSVEERVAMITQKILNGEALDAAEMSYMNSLLTMLQQPDDSLQEAGEETGSSVSEGIIAGMQSAGWDTSAETVASDLESAINQALQINSPSKLMIPVGEYVAMGIEEGAMGYGFTDAGSGMADAMYTAAEQGFYGITWANIGRFAVEGIVRGILSEKDRIIRAMREVSQAALDSARETLDIHSPSRVFRDEVGVMVMRGFGEGISGETKNQARIIRNAARYLTDEAVSGTIAGGTNNSRVYNNSNTISFDGSSFFVRDEQDVYSLAVEIAGLTERQQRGKGSRR